MCAAHSACPDDNSRAFSGISAHSSEPPETTEDARTSKYPPGIEGIIGRPRKRPLKECHSNDSDDKEYDYHASYEDVVSTSRLTRSPNSGDPNLSSTSTSHHGNTLLRYDVEDIDHLWREAATNISRENDDNLHTQNHRHQAVAVLQDLHDTLLGLQNDMREMIKKCFPIGNIIRIGRFPTFKPLRKSLNKLIEAVQSFQGFIDGSAFVNENDIQAMMYHIRQALLAVASRGEDMITVWKDLTPGQTEEQWPQGQQKEHCRRSIYTSRGEIEALRTLAKSVTRELRHEQAARLSGAGQQCRPRCGCELHDRARDIQTSPVWPAASRVLSDLYKSSPSSFTRVAVSTG